MPAFVGFLHKEGIDFKHKKMWNYDFFEELKGLAKQFMIFTISAKFGIKNCLHFNGNTAQKLDLLLSKL